MGGTQSPDATCPRIGSSRDEKVSSREIEHSLTRFGSFLQTVGVAFRDRRVKMVPGHPVSSVCSDAEGRGQYATAILYSQLFLYVGLFGGLEVVCRYARRGKSRCYENFVALHVGLGLSQQVGFTTSSCDVQ